MKFSHLMVAVFTLGFLGAGVTEAADPKDLKILYVGNERPAEYVKFLTGKVAGSSVAVTTMPAKCETELT
jgi:hypothetical protein